MPEQPFDPYRFRNWRWFWDFGGGILTDLMVHFLDVANWYLDLDHPQTAATIGDHFQAAGLWQTPDTVQTLLHYPAQGVQIYFEGTFINARNAAMLEFMGSEGTLYLDRGRYEVIPERRSKLEASEQVIGEGPRRRFLQRARRRAAASDELDRVHPQPSKAHCPGRGGRNRGKRGTFGKSRPAIRRSGPLGNRLTKTGDKSGP